MKFQNRQPNSNNKEVLRLSKVFYCAPEVENPTNENTIKSKGSGSNEIPKPSTK